MIQLVFDAGSAEEALETSRSRSATASTRAPRGRSGETSSRSSTGTHPVVYPAAGSHANFFSDSPSSAVRPRPASAATTRPARTTSSGRGQSRSRATRKPRGGILDRLRGPLGRAPAGLLQRPTGPNLKTQWTEPITWSEDWRALSAVPAGGSFGSNATDFFCGAVGAGSNFVLRAVDNAARRLRRRPPAVLVVYLLAGPGGRRRRCVGRRRSWGQTFTASWRLHQAAVALPRIGLIVIPISLVITGLQYLLFSATSLVGIDPNGEGGGFRVGLGVWIGTVLTLLALALVQAACAARSQGSSGSEIGIRAAYRLAFDSVWGLLGALAVAVGVVTVLSIRLPRTDRDLACGRVGSARSRRGARGAVRARGALRRSGRLVRLQWLKVRTLVVVAGAIAIVRTADRRAPDPPRGRAVRLRQRARRSRLRRSNAVRGHRDDVRLLRHARPRAPGRARAGAHGAPARSRTFAANGRSSSWPFWTTP